MEKYHKTIKIFNIVGAFIILILLLLLIFPNNPLSKYIETNRLGYDKDICWNRATDDFEWTNGCKGAKGVNGCTTVMVDFTVTEKTQYQSWVKAGKPITKGCE